MGHKTTMLSLLPPPLHMPPQVRTRSISKQYHKRSPLSTKIYISDAHRCPGTSTHPHTRLSPRSLVFCRSTVLGQLGAPLPDSEPGPARSRLTDAEGTVVTDVLSIGRDTVHETGTWNSEQRRHETEGHPCRAIHASCPVPYLKFRRYMRYTHTPLTNLFLLHQPNAK